MDFTRLSTSTEDVAAVAVGEIVVVERVDSAVAVVDAVVVAADFVGREVKVVVEGVAIVDEVGVAQRLPHLERCQLPAHLGAALR